MNKNELRRLNARKLAKEFSSVKEFAEYVEMDPNYVGALISDKVKNRRNIGDNVRRRIEIAFGKPDGWLDQDHELVQGIDVAILNESIVVVEDLLKELNRRPDSNMKARFFTKVYLDAMDAGSVDRASAERLIKLFL